jgi:DNA-binding PadR family transcriptional regulator
MPVHLDTHDADIDLTPGTTKSDIVAFLYRYPKYGYRPSEISDHLDIPHGTATATLARLHDKGYVGKTDDSYYHALEGREDLRRYVAGLEQLDRLFNSPDESDDSPTQDQTSEATGSINEASMDAELDELEDELGQ